MAQAPPKGAASEKSALKSACSKRFPSKLTLFFAPNFTVVRSNGSCVQRGSKLTSSRSTLGTMVVEATGGGASLLGACVSCSSLDNPAVASATISAGVSTASLAAGAGATEAGTEEEEEEEEEDTAFVRRGATGAGGAVWETASSSCGLRRVASARSTNSAVPSSTPVALHTSPKNNCWMAPNKLLNCSSEQGRQSWQRYQLHARQSMTCSPARIHLRHPSQAPVRAVHRVSSWPPGQMVAFL
eukprot:CAMPEP_0177318870 /NCGR_PEP_ID=MMETSP0368-20130122/14304_1 /TAXON_ID=447022 ORGANISM="Scrippsiella hangoei-like, Strain SHHI-4" /NCGR_SAMPLE_ID=MMETSP0368 /ASSEMBLY_ACC=CAM_ASM_000363 /LENGTH=242 /DNA_ID=CAMNT_0018778327 /DNA_START=259 /DNA_END=987 /DNA_ORIENTATION=-